MNYLHILLYIIIVTHFIKFAKSTNVPVKFGVNLSMVVKLSTTTCRRVGNCTYQLLHALLSTLDGCEYFILENNPGTHWNQKLFGPQIRSEHCVYSGTEPWPSNL